MSKWSETPGVYKGIPESEYHAAELVGSTRLAQIARSPAHVGLSIDTEATRLGSIVHTLVLEPSKIDKRYEILPDLPSLATRDGMDQWDAYLSAMTHDQWDEFVHSQRLIAQGKVKTAKAKDAAMSKPAGDVVSMSAFKSFCSSIGKSVVTAGEWSTGQNMAESVSQNSLARDLLGMTKEDERELTLVWEEDGLLCKARIDAPISNGAADLKTANNASPDAFQRKIVTYMYHQQAAHYLKGCAEHGIPCETWKWIVVESEPPYPCVVYTATDDLLIKGELVRRENMDRFASCTFSGEWPSYKNTSIDLPAYYARTINDTEEL